MPAPCRKFGDALDNCRASISSFTEDSSTFPHVRIATTTHPPTGPPSRPVVMSVATPAASRLLYRSLAANSAQTSSRAVNAAAAAASPCSQQQRHNLHTTAPLAGRKKRSPFGNVSAEKMGLIDPAKPKFTGAETSVSPDYDDTDIKSLQRRYTPKQLEALMLGEQVISAKDITEQGKLRDDPYRFTYLDDFAHIHPTIDKRVKSGKPVDTSGHFMTPEEFATDFVEWLRGDRKQEDLIDIPEAYRMYKAMREKMLSKGDRERLTAADLNTAMDSVLSEDNGGNRAQVMVKIQWQEDGQNHTRKIPSVDFSDMKAKLKQEIKDQMKEDGATAEDLEYLDVRKMSDLELRFKYGLTPEQVSILRTSTSDPMEEVWKYLHKRSIMTGFDGGDTALAPGLPDAVPGVEGKYVKELDPEDAALDPEGVYQDLKRQTGLSIAQLLLILKKQTRVLVRRYVSNQTRLGKIRSTYCLAISGCGDGRLGLGEAKSVDSQVASHKASVAAIRNMVPIRRYENRTIYGNVEGKVGGTVVRLYARPPGMLLLALVLACHFSIRLIPGAWLR